MTNEQMKIAGKAFVAGATGFTGREVVRVLREKGIPTVAHIRPDSSRIEEWRERFQKMGAEIDTTAWEIKAMTETLMALKPAYVFSLLGTTRARIKQAVKQGKDLKTQDYEAIDYGLTSLLLNAVLSAGIKPVFIYLSAVGVKPGASSPYYRARAKAEQELLQSGIPYIIARPSFIIGPDRDDKRPGELFGAKIIDGLLAFAGLLGAKKLKERYRSTSNTILANALVKLALDPEAVNKIYESEELRNRD